MPKFHLLESMQYLWSTMLSRRKIRDYKRPEIDPGDTFKTYPDAETVPLPNDWTLKEARITPLLQQRRSRRQFGEKSIALTDLAFMLWATQGVTAKAGKHLLRTSPSAGALYPIETYVVVNDVDDIAPGLYHFNVEKFSLELLQFGNFGEEIAIASLNQQFLSQAGVVFLWSSVFRRNATKYGERGLRYTFMDAAHICQNLLLAAEATGSNACPVAAFFDEELNDLLELDGEEESVIYLAGVGTQP